jgi:DNA-binding CsgD family transcriptional regulator
VLLDVAGHRGVDCLPAGSPIDAAEIEAVAKAQDVHIREWDVVLVREMLHGLAPRPSPNASVASSLATGETARQRTIEAREHLTAREAQIARLAGDGLTNSEIGAELFISHRTAEWHLRKVFTKLAVGSRSQLRGALAGS